MRRLSLLIIAATGVGLVAVGLRYLLADEFMPYHAQVAQTTWADLQPGVRTIIRGMLTIVGAGFIACGAAFLWILPAAKAGERWAPWALLCIGLLIGVPTLYVTLWLRQTSPSSDTPVGLTALLLGVVVASSLTNWLSLRKPVHR